MAGQAVCRSGAHGAFNFLCARLGRWVCWQQCYGGGVAWYAAGLLPPAIPALTPAVPPAIPAPPPAIPRHTSRQTRYATSLLLRWHSMDHRAPPAAHLDPEENLGGRVGGGAGGTQTNIITLPIILAIVP